MKTAQKQNKTEKANKSEGMQYLWGGSKSIQPEREKGGVCLGLCMCVCFMTQNY